MLTFVSNFCGILFPTFVVFCFQYLWYFVSNFCGKFIKGRQTKYQMRQTKRSDTMYQTDFKFEWCRIQESNLHGCSHGVLSTTCLPFHQSGNEVFHHQIILYSFKLFSDEWLLDYTPLTALFVSFLNNCPCFWINTSNHKQYGYKRRMLKTKELLNNQQWWV